MQNLNDTIMSVCGFTVFDVLCYDEKLIRKHTSWLMDTISYDPYFYNMLHMAVESYRNLFEAAKNFEEVHPLIGCKIRDVEKAVDNLEILIDFHQELYSNHG